MLLSWSVFFVQSSFSKPEPKPKPESKVSVKTDEMIKPKAAEIESVLPKTETKVDPKINSKVNLYNMPSCGKGFLGSVIDVLI